LGFWKHIIDFAETRLCTKKLKTEKPTQIDERKSSVIKFPEMQQHGEQQLKRNTNNKGNTNR